VVTIPYDYDENSAGSIVPICIDDIDAEGDRIDLALIELGVVPVADLLRDIAGRVLNDRWRVSEITDFAVHSIWRKDHQNFGDAPSLRILKKAHSFAEDLRVGGRRVRRRADVELFTTTLDALQDQVDLAAHLEAKDTLDRLVDQLELLGMDDIREMVPMMLRDCEAKELVRRFGKSRNTISQRFYRGMRKAAAAAGITR
jgi:DNA-directed RNA polymerase specialized sigma24 family protein